MTLRTYASQLLCLTLLASAAAAGPREDFAQLESEMQSATDAYFMALAEAESDKPEGDAAKPAIPPKPVVDRRGDILKQMDALVTSSANDPDGRFVAMNTLFWSVNVQPESLRERIEKIVQKYPDELELAELIIALPDLYAKSGTAEQWTKLLQDFVKKTSQADLKLASTFVIGRIFMDAKKLPEAKSAFEDAIKLAKEEPEAAKAAKSFIFEIEHLQIGMKAPDFKVKSIDDKDLTLKELRGKVVLLNFWASWCAPCVAEIPHLQKVAEGLKGKPFEILAVSLDESQEAVTNLMKVRKMPGIVVWDEPGKEGNLAERFNVQSLPTWYLLDREGVIRQRDPEPDKLEAIIRPLLTADSDKPEAKPSEPEKPKKP